MKIVLENINYNIQGKILDTDATRQLIKDKTSIQIKKDPEDDFQMFLSIVKIATESPSLKKIKLSNNNLGGVNTLEVAKQLAESTSLESINLSFNQIGRHRSDIHHTLMEMPSLKHLIGILLPTRCKKTLSERALEDCVENDSEWVQVRIPDEKDCAWVEITREALDPIELGWITVPVKCVGDASDSGA